MNNLTKRLLIGNQLDTKAMNIILCNFGIFLLNTGSFVFKRIRYVITENIIHPLICKAYRDETGITKVMNVIYRFVAIIFMITGITFLIMVNAQASEGCKQYQSKAEVASDFNPFKTLDVSKGAALAVANQITKSNGTSALIIGTAGTADGEKKAIYVFDQNNCLLNSEITNGHKYLKIYNKVINPK